MIIVKLDGGLGNQLFQYAFGRALAYSKSTKLILDKSLLLKARSNITLRSFELDFFQYKAISSLIELPIFIKLLCRLKWVAEILGLPFVYTERSTGFDRYAARLPANVIVTGYWQSFKYFDKYAPEIMNDLDSHRALSNVSQGVLSGIRSHQQTVAIHIRRGDYVSNVEAKNFHGSLHLDYYEDAISYARLMLGSVKFIIFSDDPTWCRNNLTFDPNEALYISHNFASEAWQDLILMSYCKHHIIANSSFSWWGAWIADQRVGKERLVIAPERWFISAKNNASDRFPSHWILL